MMKHARSVFSSRSPTLSRRFERIRKGAAKYKEISRTPYTLKCIMRVYLPQNERRRVIFDAVCGKTARVFFTRKPT